MAAVVVSTASPAAGRDDLFGIPQHAVHGHKTVYRIPPPYLTKKSFRLFCLVFRLRPRRRLALCHFTPAYTKIIILPDH